jgi:alpha-N-arabinofuranosidase
MTTSLSFIFAALSLGLGVALGQDTSAPLTATLPVKTRQPGADINRNIYGQFSEHLGHCIYGGVWVGEDNLIPNTRGIRNDVVAALKRIKVPRAALAGRLFCR